MTRTDFLDNLRVARNLLIHNGLVGQCRHLSQDELASALKRAAIWLTPYAVKGFRADQFQELGPTQQKTLADTVENFKQIAKQVPPDAFATDEQYQEAKAALEKISTILDKYIQNYEETALIRKAFAILDNSPWVVNWDFEVGVDHVDEPAVRVMLYIDDKAVPINQLGKRMAEMIPKLQSALTAVGIKKWVYIYMRSAQEYKIGLGSYGHGDA